MAFLVVSVVALVFGFVGSLPMAGPIAILVVSNAANERYAEARRTAYGAALAEGFYAFLAFWGFATFLARHKTVLPISHGLTGVILVVLGVYFVRFQQKDEKEKEEARPQKTGGPFLMGLSVSALNPTLIATWSAVTTFLYSRQIVHMNGWLAIPFGVCAGLGIMLWAQMMVWLLRRFREHFPKKALTWVVRGMGIILMALGVWSCVELGRYLLDPTSRPNLEESSQMAPSKVSGAQTHQARPT